MIINGLHGEILSLTPFSVHLVSNQILGEGSVAIETFAKVLHPEN